MGLVAIAAILLASTLAATAAPPSAGAETECDAIAGLPPPITSTAEVHPRLPIDWPRGVTVCTAEVQAHPDEIRFLYLLGRAQDRTKNYIEALRDYRAAADAGYTEALYDFGVMYYYGHGVVQNYLTAYEYFNKAAVAGSRRAFGSLAAMFANGDGVAKDNTKSLEYAEKAAQAGNPTGLKIIADHYFNGAGVPRDYRMAGQYLQQAADLGDGSSMKFLANMYESGYLGPPDAAKAAELRILAQKEDPASSDPNPAHLPMLRQASTQPAQSIAPAARRGTSTGSYNPAWQAAPGDTSCCPNNMLVCPLGRHFCAH